MYEEIVRKLGFEPKNFKFQPFGSEYDKYDNPFEKLTLEELIYLQENNYFMNKQPD